MRPFVTLGLMAASLMLLAPTLQAQDVTGAWTLTYSQPGRQGGQAREVSMDVTLVQDGAVITGTAMMAMGRRGGANPPQPQEIPISDGKIEDGKVTFSINRTMGERTMSTVFSGTVAGNEMTGTMTRAGARAGEPIPFKGVKKEG